MIYIIPLLKAGSQEGPHLVVQLPSPYLHKNGKTVHNRKETLDLGFIFFIQSLIPRRGLSYEKQELLKLTHPQLQRNR